MRDLFAFFMALIVFCTVFYSMYCFGTTRNKGYAIIACLLCLPSLALLMFTAEFVEYFK